ncbi:hypothetical protein Cpir12675_005753 [Ceratocystis pirilliformis]|uniref:Uncharacterized protein n=1 Tax=Ceratocystis pirilliformis TaxID=259994 RepID=A0ABR3YMF1_9PEZI
MTTSRSSRRRSQAAAAAAASHINASLHTSPSNLQPITRRSTIATSTSTSASVATASAVASTSPAAAAAAPSSASSSSLPSHHSHEPEQEMSSAIKGGHSLRRRKTVDYGENAASAAPHGAASSSSLGHLDSTGRDIGYRTRTQTGAVAKTRKRIVDDDSGEDDVPAAKRRNGTSSSSSTSATAPTPSAAPPSLTPRKNPTRASRRPPKSSRFVDSDSEDNQAQQDTPASSRPSRLRAAANGKGTKKTMARSSSSSTAHSHPSDAEQSHDESSAPSDDACQDGGPDDLDSDTDLSESIMPHRRSTVGPKLPSNERRFPSILPLNLSTGSLLGLPKEQAKMYRDASEYHQRVPELDVVRALPDGQQEVYRTRNYRLKQGERVYQAVSGK